MWRKSGAVAPFPLGAKDLSEKLRLPDVLIGREREREHLAASFGRAAKGAVELVLIGGPSGIGKTALVRTVYRDIAQAGRGLLIAGKHDQLGRSTPYAALAQSFGDLMRQWLASPEAVLKAWQERIKSEVGDNARLIADVVPELDLVMGKLAPVPPVHGEQVLTRQKLTWLNFVRAIATPSAPLVMFLDDMQWADSATLEILKTLLADVEQQGLLVIAAYRDNEVPAEHPLWKAVEAVDKSGAKVSRMSVGPLSEEQVEAWAARTLNGESARVAPLSRVLWQKTRGNPFFMEQLLLSLHRQGKVVRDLESGDWRWSLKQLEQAQVTENVVTLLTAKVRDMPEATRALLGLAACAGHMFHLEDLERLSGWARPRVTEALWPALLEELVVPVDGAYRPAQALGQTGELTLDAEYRFLHDRVQQACYEQISPEQRVLAHLEIGRRLWAQIRTQGDTPRRLLETVRHLNLGSARMDDAEREALAHTNLAAARAAKAASSYGLLATLVESAQVLLGERAWQKEPELSVELALERLEAAFLLREFEDVEARSVRLLAMPLPARARLSAQELRVRSSQAAGQFARGVEQSCAALAEQSIVFPATDEGRRAALVEESAELDRWFEHDPDAFDRMPPDPASEHVLVDALMMHLMVCAAIGDQPVLCALVIARAVQRVRARGVLTPVAPFVISCFANVWSLATGMYRRSACWVGAGLRAAERVASPFLAECLSFQGQYSVYSRPADEMGPVFERCFATGLRIGSFQGTSWGLEGELFYHRTWRGQPLDMIEAHRAGRWGVMQRAGTTLGKHYFEAIASWCDLLTNKNGATMLRSEEPLSRGSRSLLADGNGMAAELARLLEAHLFLVAGTYPMALSRAREAELFRMSIFGFPNVTDVPLWLALAAAKCWREANVEERARLREHIEHGLARLRYFAEGCAENFLHKLRLVEAEYARIKGNCEEAMARYDEAIDRAREQRFLHIEALAAQFCAEFHLDAGRTRVGALYLGEARDAYARWDARAVVAHLEAKYPSWLKARPSVHTAGASATTTMSTATTVATKAGLDVGTVVRAARALSSELDPERVAGRLMELVLQNAGAQRGALVLSRGDTLSVVARLSAPGTRIETGLLEPLEQARDVAMTAVEYVARTREPLVLSDAQADPCFSADRHVRASQVHSVLAVPLIHRGRLGGVLYLEHASPAAFPAARVMLLSTLASHCAIALQNASLYADLQGQIAERRRVEEAQRYQNRILNSVLISIADGVVVADARGRLLFTNPAAEAILGTATRTELSEEQGGFHDGLYLPDTVTPYPLARLPLTRAMAGEATDGVEMFVRNSHRPQGAWVRVSGRALSDESGTVHGGVVVFHDVSAHKWAEVASRFLAEASRKLATSLDPEATVQHIAELPIGELADASLVCLVDEKEGLVPAAVAGLSDARPSCLLDMLRRRQPEAFTAAAVLESWATVPLVARGHCLGLLCLFASEQGRWRGAALPLAEELGRRAALALDNARLYQAARQAIRVRDEFLIIASHELRTPLTSVLLQIQSLERRARQLGTPPPDPHLDRALVMLRRQIDHLAGLIEELLDVSAIRAGRLQLRLEDLELTGLVRAVLARIESQSARAGCRIAVVEEGVVHGSWDRSRIDQVVVNLLANAMKYAPNKPITVTVRKEGQVAELVVEDQGIGICKADQQRIFQRFARAEAVQHHYRGFGLGLYIVRQVVEAHGGTIQVHSELGHGARFVVQLPLHGEESGGWPALG